MKKYITLWISATIVVSLLLFLIPTLISKTEFTNIFAEFEIILMLLGFSTTISTMITCTYIIKNK